MSPFPGVAQILRDRIELARGGGHVVCRQGRDRGGQAGLVGLDLRLALLVQCGPGDPLGPYREDDGGNCAQQERREDAQHAAHQRPVPPGKFAELVQRRRSPGPDRLVAQVAPDIRRKIPRGGITPRLIFSSAVPTIVSTSPRKVASVEPSRAGSRSRITKAASGKGRFSSRYGRRPARSSKRITPRVYTSERASALRDRRRPARGSCS